jgi:outer membrane usher protein
LDENFEYESFSVPLEIGSNINDSLFLSNFSYTKNEADSEEKFVRLNSSVTVDDPSIYSRLVMGDFSAASGALGGGGSYGGLSYSSSFSPEPFFITSPGVDLTFQVESPSEVEIYVNNLFIERRRLSPGEYTFSNLPHTAGSGKITVVIKDSFGRVRTFEKDFYSSPALLKPGIQEFSYNIGLEREQFGEESFDYGEETFLAFHRFGITKSLTAGFRIETDSDVVSAGPTADFVLGRFGVFNLAFAGSYAEKEYGYAGLARYSYSNRYFNIRMSGSGFTREYANLSLSPADDKSRSETSAGIGFNLGLLGSISASRSLTESFGATDTTRTSLFYSLRLLNGLSLNATASRTEDDDVTDEASISLNFLPGGGISGNLNRQYKEDRTVESVAIQKNAPTGPGFGFRLQAGREEVDLGETTEDESASIQVNGPYGIYNTEYRRTDEVDSYTLRASGAISYLGGSLHLSRPIVDSFALVEIGELEDVRIYSNNQYIGKTSRRGRLLAPDIISYSNNKLSIEDKDIPVNYHITDLEKYIATPLRAGGVLEFNIVKLQGFTGYLFFTEKGERKPAEYAALEIKVGEDLITTVVGRDGEFYLENIPSGKWPARLYLQDSWCGFTMFFPESDDIFVDMGEQSCEIN